MFAAFPTPTYATYGNVDIPTLWPEYAGPGTTVLDGERVEIGGRVFGFVGGGLRTPMRTPYEISDEEYAAKVEALGEVDVLCSHIPPEVPELMLRHRRPPLRARQPAPCWTRSAAPGPGTRSSATSTSRWSAGCGSAPPSASTSATSRRPGRPGRWSGDRTAPGRGGPAARRRTR